MSEKNSKRLIIAVKAIINELLAENKKLKPCKFY